MIPEIMGSRIDMAVNAKFEEIALDGLPNIQFQSKPNSM